MDGKKGYFYLATLAAIVSIIFLLPAFSVIVDDDYPGTTSSGQAPTTQAPSNRPLQIDGVNCTTIISNYRSAQSSLARAQMQNNTASIASIKKYLSDNLWKYNKCMGISATPTTVSASSTSSSTGVTQVACTMDARICPDGSAVGRVGPNCEFAPCPTEGTTTSKPPQPLNECETIKRDINSAYGAYQNAYRLNDTEKMASIKEAIAKLEEKYKACLGDVKEIPNQPIPRPVNKTLSTSPAKPIDNTPCGEAKGLGERVIYLKGLLALSDEELLEKGLTREDVKKKFEDADRAYNTAMYNCAEKKNVTFSPVSPEGPCEQAKELEQRILYIKKILGLPENEFLEKFAGKNRTSFEGELSGLSEKYSALVSKCREAQGEQIANHPCGKPPAELLEKYAVSVQKMNEARNSGDESRLKELEKYLVEIRKEIASYNKCAVSQEEKPGETRSSDAKSISEYYRAQLAKVPGNGSENTLDNEIARLTALREEINLRIKALVEKKSAIDARELSGIAKIEISDSGVSVNGENVSDATEGGEVIANIGISEASIVSANGTVSIDDGSDFETTAKSPVTVENGRLKMKDKNVSTSPGEFAAALRFAPEKVELGEDEKGAPQYVAKSTEKRRLFFIIPVTAQVVQRMNAENGTFYNEERPFWVFLSSKVK